MFYKIVSLYDKKAEVFSPVQAVPNTNAFIRVLSDEINAPPTPDRRKEVWADHPEDFVLYEVGLFDDATAAVETNVSVLVELSTLVRS